MMKYLPWITIIGQACCVGAAISSANDVWLYAALALPFGMLWVVA